MAETRIWQDVAGPGGQKWSVLVSAEGNVYSGLGFESEVIDRTERFPKAPAVFSIDCLRDDLLDDAEWVSVRTKTIDREVAYRDRQVAFKDILRHVFDSYLYESGDDVDVLGRTRLDDTYGLFEARHSLDSLRRHIVRIVEPPTEPFELEFDYSDTGPSADVIVPSDVDWEAVPKPESFSTLFDIQYELDNEGA